MSQDIWTSINPLVTSGTTLATILNSFSRAILSGFSGTSRPPNLQAKGWWIDTTNAASPNYYYAFKLWTGTVDIEVFRININSGFGGGTVAIDEFDITKISADTSAAILGLIKQRIATQGQVFDGDVIGEIQLVGRTNTSTNPVVGNFKWTTSDNETSSVFGGYLSVFSVPDATANLTEHFRMITGLVETIVPHKQNSLRLVGQNVATTATITQLSATKVLVEFTGSTATAVDGINSGQDTQEIVLHNRSTATVTLKHQNAGATAVDRFKLPNSLDILIIADATVVLYYCTTDTRWKIKSTGHAVLGKNQKILRGVISDWTAPTSVTQVLVTSYKRRQIMGASHATCIDPWGTAYSWGFNPNGGLGDGTQVGKSTPTAIIGGKAFAKFADGNTSLATTATFDANWGIDTSAVLYAWGVNDQGQLGLGDVVPRSSPVAVLGGSKWAFVWGFNRGVMGTTMDGHSYAWGRCVLGTLSAATQNVSSPVAIFAGTGAAMEQFVNTQPVGNGEALGALDSNGAAYFWGGGANASFAQGGAGAGATNLQPAISTPVAVIGGLTFKKIWMANLSTSVWCLGLTKDGALYGWGANGVGQLGVGDRTARSSPVAVMAGTTFIDAFLSGWSGSNSATCGIAFAIADDGTLYAWGSNADGQLGLGDVTGRSSPVAVLGGFKFRELMLGTPSGATCNSVLGITLEGDMYGWGNNGSGALGLGDVTSRSSPVAVLGANKWSQFACREYRNLTTPIAVSTDGIMYAWGSGAADAGFGDLNPRSSPVAVTGGVGFDNQRRPVSNMTVAAIPVTPGSTYRIFCPNGRQARFGSYDIGLDIEQVTLEYDTRGD